jgi:hypothetical protein
MIIVKIYGGLAGQMMQYAFANFLEVKKKEQVKLDISFYGEQKHNISFRKFELLNLNTSFSIATEDDYKQIFSEVKFSDKIQFKLFNKPVKSNVNFIESKPFCYDSEVLNQSYKIYDGYWVNSQYMPFIESKLKKDFTPRYPINPKNNDLLNRIESSNSVSIHFRRGDYLVHENHNVMNDDYYYKAIDYIKRHVSNPLFYVFSDDIEYIRATYDILGDAVFIDHNKGEEAYWDIFLMSKCKHNIIANSGFSYWGAWLNTHSNANVIAPSTWMQSDNKIVENLLLPNWYII